MKSLLYTILAAFSILLPLSCTSVHDNNGFPSKVKFSKDGGRIVIYGNHPISFDALHIYESSKIWYGNWECEGKDTIKPSSQFNCTFTVNSEWLTIINKTNTDSIVFIATPNNTGKKRKCHIVPSYDGNYFAVINIQQDK